MYFAQNLVILAPGGLHNPVSIYLLKVYNENTRKRCEICLIYSGSCSSGSIDNFEHVVAGWEFTYFCRSSYSSIIESRSSDQCKFFNSNRSQVQIARSPYILRLNL